MSWFYRQIVRPWLFETESEEIHNRTLQTLAWVSEQEFFCEALSSFFGAPELPQDLWGLHFPNPVGLAAGMDKHAAAVPAWAALGFGFSELGGVTWHGQPGNPPPRLFRAIADEALVNRMGFNNPGAEAIASKLASWKAAERWPKHPVGINLGKSKITPQENAAEDYANSLRLLWPYADFFVVNVSSPNTPNLRQLQDKDALDQILAMIQQVNLELAKTPGAAAAPHAPAPEIRPKPILVKIAPDLTFEAIDDILTLVSPRGLSGIVATNTTIARPQSSDPALQRIYAETGGLSGRPLRARSTEVIRHIHRQTRGTLPIIGVGGIFSAEDAWEKFAAGASLIQIYTGLIYQGPTIARTIIEGLLERMSERGFRHIQQVVGTGC